MAETRPQTQEEIAQYVTHYVDAGGTQEQALTYMTKQGWIKPIQQSLNPIEERSRMLMANGALDPELAYKMAGGKMDFMERFATYYGDQSIGFGQDFQQALQDQPYWVRANPITAIPAAFAGAMSGVRSDSPEWRKTLHHAKIMQSGQSSPSEKVLFFGTTVALDALISSPKAMLALGRYPTQAIAKQVLGKDFFEHGFAVGVDEAINSAVREEVVDQAARLGVDIQETLLRKTVITGRMMEERVGKNLAADVAEEKYLDYLAGLTARFLRQVDDVRGTVVNPRELSVGDAFRADRVKNPTSFFDVGTTVGDRGRLFVDDVGKSANDVPLPETGGISRLDPGPTRYELEGGLVRDPAQSAKLHMEARQRAQLQGKNVSVGYPDAPPVRKPVLDPALEAAEDVVERRARLSPQLKNTDVDDLSTLYTRLEEGYHDNIIKLNSAYEPLIRRLRTEADEVWKSKNMRDWVEEADRFVDKNLNPKDVYGQVAKTLDEFIQQSKKRTALPGDFLDVHGLVASRIAAHPRMLSDEGIEAAELLPGWVIEEAGTNKWTNHKRFFRWVRRQMAVGVNSGFREGAGLNLMHRTPDPKAREFWGSLAGKKYEHLQNAVQARTFQWNLIGQEVDDAISAYSRWTGKTIEEVGEEITGHRIAKGGPTYSMIPDTRLREAVQSSVEARKELTNAMIDLMGPKPTEEERALIKVMGDALDSYMHTSYKKHHVKGWANKVRHSAEWDAAFKSLVKKYGITEQNPSGLTDNQVRGLMMAMLNRNSADTAALFSGAGKHGKSLSAMQDLSELKAKGMLSPEIQALFGLEKDFAVDMQITGLQMIQDVEATKFLYDLAEEGVKRGVFRMKPEVKGAGAYSEKISFSKLASDVELYGTPEAKIVLDAMMDPVGKQNAMTVFNGVIKMGKVALSPRTLNRNAWSALPMLLASNAFLGLKHPKETLRAAKESSKLFAHMASGGKTRVPKELRRDFVRSMELGNISQSGSGVFSGEMRVWSEQSKDALKGIPVAGKAIEFMQNAYIGVDNAMKDFGWRMHRMILDDMLDGTDDALKARTRAFMKDAYGSADTEVAASNIAKNTLQHWDYAPVIGKTLSKNPLFGTFVSFPMEMIRTQANGLRYAGKELKFGIETGQAKWMAHGASRLASLVAAQQGLSAMEWMGKEKLGIGDEQMAAVRRRILPPYARHNDIVPLDKVKQVFSYLDAGFANPYSFTSELIKAAITDPGAPGSTIGDRLIAQADVLADTILGYELGAGALAETVMGVKLDENLVSSILKPQEKRYIIEPGHELKRQLIERAYHGFKEMAPGAINSLDKGVESVTGRRGLGLVPYKPRFQDYDPAAEALGLFGLPRIAQSNIADTMSYHFWAERKKWEQLSKAFASDVRQFEGRPEDLNDSVQAKAEMWEKRLDEFQLLREDAMVLGVPPAKINEMIEANMLNPSVFPFRKEVKERLMRGERVPFVAAFPYLEKYGY